MNKLYDEIKKKILDISNAKVFTSTNSTERDTKTLSAYSDYLNAKSNEELLKTIKNYNRVMIGFGVLNLVFLFVNLYLFFNQK